MKVKLNGVDIECTPEEFRQLNLGREIKFPRQKIHRKRRGKDSLERLQRTLSPVLGTNRGRIGRWNEDDDKYLTENYPSFGKRGERISGEALEKIEKICHRLGRTPRAIRQRAWFLQRTQQG